MLGTESPFTGLQSGAHLKSHGGRCNLFVDMYIEAEFSVEEHSEPSNHSRGHDGSAIGKCNRTLWGVSLWMEMDKFGFGVVKGYCIFVSPFKGSPGHWFQFFAIFLLTISNNKAGNIVDIAGCGRLGMLLLDGGEK